MMDEARVCSRCQKHTCTPGQRYCKECKRDSKLKHRQSWAGGITAFLRNRSTRPVLPDTEPLQDGPLVELEDEGQKMLPPALPPPVETAPVPVEEHPASVLLPVILSLDRDTWADLDDAAARDCISVDAFLSKTLENMRSLYAAL